MKSQIWRKAAVFFGIILLGVCMPANAGSFPAAGNARLGATVRAAEEQSGKEAPEIKPSELYARSAVLMDADSGRILFAKNGREEMSMASTTKIMTCILALENGNPEERAGVSSEAASQPEVKLGMKSGQSFYLKDLLYSLMLESHNDSAVAIAELIGGSVQGFADMMNEKAKELGCRNTYFITPNGLDASDGKGIHHTTAEELAKIMRYCIMESEKKEEFLEITRTASYSFSDADGNGSYLCTNHNAFLKMMEGALTGKTGFTADAGYCYVGALRRDERTFIVSLLACGWPNNKGYKWADTRKLMDYALEQYHYETVQPSLPESDKTLSVKNGYKSGFPEMDEVEVRIRMDGKEKQILMKKGEEILAEYKIPDQIPAPVKKGQKVGEAVYSMDGKQIAVYPVTADEDVGERTLKVCISWIIGRVLM